jgi:hypothetical protein
MDLALLGDPNSPTSIYLQLKGLCWKPSISGNGLNNPAAFLLGHHFFLLLFVFGGTWV